MGTIDIIAVLGKRGVGDCVTTRSSRQCQDSRLIGQRAKGDLASTGDPEDLDIRDTGDILRDQGLAQGKRVGSVATVDIEGPKAILRETVVSGPAGIEADTRSGCG